MYTIYTKANCPMCDQAKALLRMRGIAFEEIKIIPEGITAGSDLHGDRTILIEHFKAMYPMQRTAPLIIKNGIAIGGFTELKENLNILLG